MKNNQKSRYLQKKKMSFSWSKLFSKRRSDPNKSVRSLSLDMDLPKSTVHYQMQKQDERVKDETTRFFESESGSRFLKRLIVGTIYTFCLKGGSGAGRVKEFFELIQLQSHVGISESSVLRVIKEIELSILKYKELQESDLQASHAYSKELEVVLGLDETWLDEMLLVCQDLVSGFLFLKMPLPVETPKVGGQD